MPKKYPDKTKQPYNDINAATVDLREAASIPWAWLDEHATRSASTPFYRDTIAEDLIRCLGICHLNVWGDDEPPLILCESRGVATVLAATAREYGVALAATGGQSAGFLVNDIAPLVGTTARCCTSATGKSAAPATTSRPTAVAIWRNMPTVSSTKIHGRASH